VANLGKINAWRLSLLPMFGKKDADFSKLWKPALKLTLPP
jgi:hypothetical protein